MILPPHLEAPSGPSLVLFVGLQGSGKSSFYRRYLAAHHMLISKDLLRNNKRPQRRQMRLLDDALDQGHAVVIDNTNPTPDDRAPLIALAREHDVPITGYYFHSKLSLCLARNAAREGRARVPDVALYTTAKKLQPPSYDEGFDLLFHVAFVENDPRGIDGTDEHQPDEATAQAFRISDWQP